MFERELVIAGLRRQDELIGELIDGLRRTGTDPYRVATGAGKVSRNLAKLRKIKDDYCLFHDSLMMCTRPKLEVSIYGPQPDGRVL